MAEPKQRRKATYEIAHDGGCWRSNCTLAVTGVSVFCPTCLYVGVREIVAEQTKTGHHG